MTIVRCGGAPSDDGKAPVRGGSGRRRRSVARDDVAEPPPAAVVDHELDVGEQESRALEEQWLIEVAREGVREAVAHVEACRVTARPAETPMGIPRDERLRDRERLDSKVRVGE